MDALSGSWGRGRAEDPRRGPDGWSRPTGPNVTSSPRAPSWDRRAAGARSGLAGTGLAGTGLARAGAVFHGLDGAQKVAETDFVALLLRVGQPLGDRDVGLFFRLAGLGQGQLCPDADFEFVQEGVIAGRGAHLFSRRDLNVVEDLA